MSKFLRYWGPAVVWFGVMTFLSTDSFSAQNTSQVVYQIFRAIGIPYVHWEFYHFLVRKSAHIMEFAVFSGLMFHAFRGTTLPELRRAWAPQWAWWAWGVCVLAGAANEIQQIFVPSRTPALHDVVIDSAGAALAQLLIWLVLRKRQRRGAAQASAA